MKSLQVLYHLTTFVFLILLSHEAGFWSDRMTDVLEMVESGLDEREGFERDVFVPRDGGAEYRAVATDILPNRF